ncbi:MAG: hypothetical protein V4490_07705, partial [Pseudomonadota bacterium]
MRKGAAAATTKNPQGQMALKAAMEYQDDKDRVRHDLAAVFENPLGISVHAIFDCMKDFIDELYKTAGNLLSHPPEEWYNQTIGQALSALINTEGRFTQNSLPMLYQCYREARLSVVDNADANSEIVEFNILRTFHAFLNRLICPEGLFLPPTITQIPHDLTEPQIEELRRLHCQVMEEEIVAMAAMFHSIRHDNLYKLPAKLELYNIPHLDKNMSAAVTGMLYKYFNLPVTTNTSEALMKIYIYAAADVVLIMRLLPFYILCASIVPDLLHQHAKKVKSKLDRKVFVDPTEIAALKSLSLQFRKFEGYSAGTQRIHAVIADLLKACGIQVERRGDLEHEVYSATAAAQPVEPELPMEWVHSLSVISQLLKSMDVPGVLSAYAQGLREKKLTPTAPLIEAAIKVYPNFNFCTKPGSFVQDIRAIGFYVRHNCDEHVREPHSGGHTVAKLLAPYYVERQKLSANTFEQLIENGRKILMHEYGNENLSQAVFRMLQAMAFAHCMIYRKDDGGLDCVAQFNLSEKSLQNSFKVLEKTLDAAGAILNDTDLYLIWPQVNIIFAQHHLYWAARAFTLNEYFYQCIASRGKIFELTHGEQYIAEQSCLALIVMMSQILEKRRFSNVGLFFPNVLSAAETSDLFLTSAVSLMVPLFFLNQIELIQMIAALFRRVPIISVRKCVMEVFSTTFESRVEPHFSPVDPRYAEVFKPFCSDMRPCNSHEEFIEECRG